MYLFFDNIGMVAISFKIVYWVDMKYKQGQKLATFVVLNVTM